MNSLVGNKRGKLRITPYITKRNREAALCCLFALNYKCRRHALAYCVVRRVRITYIYALLFLLSVNFKIYNFTSVIVFKLLSLFSPLLASNFYHSSTLLTERYIIF